MTDPKQKRRYRHRRREACVRVVEMHGDEQTGMSLNEIALQLGIERWEAKYMLRKGREILAARRLKEIEAAAKAPAEAKEIANG